MSVSPCPSGTRKDESESPRNTVGPGGGGGEEKGGRRDGRDEREGERRAEGSQRRSERSAPNEEAQPFTTNEISRAF